MRLNIDLGELPDEPDELYRLAHVANVACGGHAGDRASMARAVDLATSAGTAVGAHPSYPDRPGFGRRAMTMAPHALRDSVAGQCRALHEAAVAAGVDIAYVKAHGALYHAAARDEAIAEAFIAGATAALGNDLTILGPDTATLREAVMRAGLTLWREGFADRGVRADGSLVPRGEPGDVLQDPIAAHLRAEELLASGSVETVCVHGDTPGAVALARAVRAVCDAR